nr:2,3-dimethylmalate lyase [Quercus suber]
MASIAMEDTIFPTSHGHFGTQGSNGNGDLFSRDILSPTFEQYSIPTTVTSATEHNIQARDTDGTISAKHATMTLNDSSDDAAGIREAAPAVQLPAISPRSRHVAKIPASTRLQNMIHDTQDLIVCPGVYDGLSARTAIEVGFDALYMTGAGTAASRLGMADLGLATLSDMRAHAEMICNLKPDGPPLIADMDTGYGVELTVHLPGHLKGKAVVPREEYYTRIRAAVLAKEHMGSDIVLIARTDALQQRGYEECVERLKVARELGADVGLLEGFTSKEQARKCVQDLAGWPLLLNSVENGASPLITVDEARDMGFRIMIFSFASIAPAYQAIRATFLKLKSEGIIGTKGAITPKKIFEVCGLDDLMNVDMGSGSTSFEGGV